jgi:hypothetical protein
MDTFLPVEVDRTAFEVTSLFDEDDEMAYWLKQSPGDRLRAVELMRRILYGYHQSAPRLQRVFEVAQRPRG